MSVPVCAAPVNKIISLSTVDGPGARTSIFLQGCNIACAYCHNPETQRLCNECGECVPVCPAGALAFADGVEWDEAKCVQCDACIAKCPNFASPKVRSMTPGAVMKRVMERRRFIRGITVSGGECTLYPDFLTELFTLARAEGLTTLIDTNGMLDFADRPELLDVCDGVMLDVKAWDKDVYSALTGATDNAIVKKNLEILLRRELIEELRVVYLNGEVDGSAILEGLAQTLGDAVAIVKLKLIAFRCNGAKGRMSGLASPSDEEMQALKDRAQELGFARVSVV